MNLIVFLKNKLISADAMTPLIMELRAKLPGLDAEFVIFDKDTEKSLKENRILWDAMSLAGRVTVLSRRDRSRLGVLRHRLRIIPTYLRYVTALITGRAILVHFGQMRSSRLRFLCKIAGRNELLVDSAFASLSDLESRFDSILRPRKVSTDQFEAPRVLAFDPRSNVFASARGRGAAAYLMGPPHLMPSWITHVETVAGDALRREVEGMPFADKPVIAFMLGHMGHLDFMRSGVPVSELFEETLDVLLAACPRTPILIKPHAITDMKIVNDVLDRKADPRLRISFLHPSVLLQGAAFFIANYYSSTLSTAVALGCPTIEYADYSDAALALSGNGSMRPDAVTHFVMRDKERLAEIAGGLAGGNWQMVKSSKRPPIDSKFVDYLSRVAPHLSNPSKFRAEGPAQAGIK